MDSRRRAIMGIKKGRLPSAYQEVEYLESTGTQYIDTGVYVNINSTLDIDIQMTDTTTLSGGSIMLCGGRNTGEGNADNSFLVGVSRTNQTFYAQFDSVNNVITTPACDLLRHNIKLSEDGFYCDNVLCRTFPDASPINPLYTFTIFMGANGGGTGSALSFSKFKLFKCVLNDISYIPCYRKQDNKPGLYDLVNDVFYTNANTQASQDFIVGQNV